MAEKTASVLLFTATATKYSLNLLATGSAVLPAAVLLGMGIIAVSGITLYALHKRKMN